MGFAEPAAAGPQSQSQDRTVVAARVTTTLARIADSISVLHFAGDTVRATPEHPFFVDGRGWVPAARLAVGDKVRTPHGVAVITAASEQLRGQHEQVYNLRVERRHTYYVGAKSALVHNGGCTERLVDAPSEHGPALVRSWTPAQLEALGGHTEEPNAIERSSETIFRGKAPPLGALLDGLKGKGHTFALPRLSTDEERELNLSSRIVGPEGRIGSVNVSFLRDAKDDVLRVHLSLMELRASEQQKGIAKLALQTWIPLYERAGVDEIGLTAILIGRYTWASLGWTWADAATARTMQTALRNFLLRNKIPNADEKSEIAKKGANAVATFVVDGRHIGKEFLLDKRTPIWEGRLSLRADDPGLQTVKKKLGL